MSDLKKICVKIIKNNASDDAKNKIAKLKNPLKDDEKIGLKKAEELFNIYTEQMVKYDLNKHMNNIDSYYSELKKVRTKKYY